MNTTLFPVIFVGHGSPMNAIEHNEFSNKWAELGKQLPTPDAILCISAHWMLPSTNVTLSRHPQTIHDFGGFPKELSEIQYPAPGDPDLVQEVVDLIHSKDVFPDLQWGLDHGCWSVLKHLYPNANIPVIQFSLDETLSSSEHFELAKELAPLREKKILILCSGNIVHNLRTLDWDKRDEPEFGFDWALTVNNTVKELINAGNFDMLCHYEKLGKELVRMAIPTPDHYWPMLYALALKKENEKVTYFNDKLVMGALSMTSFIIQ
jgi:4,5-DOPA dioxygenase extradiol